MKPGLGWAAGREDLIRARPRSADSRYCSPTFSHQQTIHWTVCCLVHDESRGEGGGAGDAVLGVEQDRPAPRQAAQHELRHRGEVGQ